MAPRPLSDFIYEGKPLKNPKERYEDCVDDLEKTTWVINQLRLSQVNEVRWILDKTTVS